MKKLTENLFRHIVPINEGYDYLFSDVVYIPVFDTSLIVTKRTIMPISLVEEKVLQLLDIGVVQIDEMAHILGLKRKLLDVTLADLYSKNLVSVSSNSCKIMTAGRDALNNLNRTEKKQDVLKNVYLDGILGNVIDAASDELLSNVRDNDGKLKPTIQLGDVKCYTEKFKKISQIFEEENRLFFSEGVQPIKEELLKIDKVDNTFVKYIKIPIHVYVSSNGVDIDVVEVFHRQNGLLELYKDYIIEQINNKKVLKSHFKYRKLRQQGYEGDILEQKQGVFEELKRVHFSNKKKNIDYNLLSSDILCSRKLMDGEYTDILKYLVSEKTEIELFVYNLDDWAYDKQFLGTLTENIGQSSLSIFWGDSNNELKAQKQIGWNFKGLNKCMKCETEYFICWNVGEYQLYGLPETRKVIDDNTTCICISYYLKNNIKKVEE